MARRRAVELSATKTEFPEGVVKADTQYPKWRENNPVKVVETLTFIRSERFGWVVTTLAINARQNRYYAATLDGETCTVGNPKSQLLTVYVKESRATQLSEWIKASKAGEERAGEIRDRIGSRRAEGQERRARGETYWRWSR